MNISSQTISMSQTNISVLGCGTVLLRPSFLSLGSKLHLSSVSAVCPSPAAQTWLVCVLWAPFQLTPPPALRHHLPTNMVTEKVNLCAISPPHSDRGWGYPSLAHLVTSLCGGGGGKEFRCSQTTLHMLD